MVADQPAGGFAPNCNVQVQFVEMSLDAYLDLTRQQFEAGGFDLLEYRTSTVSSHPARTLEYAGQVGGRSLRFLALVVSGADRFWLVTCTATAVSPATSATCRGARRVSPKASASATISSTRSPATTRR